MRAGHHNVAVAPRNSDCYDTQYRYQYHLYINGIDRRIYYFLLQWFRWNKGIRLAYIIDVNIRYNYKSCFITSVAD